MAELIHDVFGPVKFEVFEAQDVINGQAVLGKLKGTFFVPDGISRNKRFYSKSVWEKQLQKEDIQQKLKELRFFGTIGHKIPISDESLAEGKLSHITTALSIRDGEGVGEALILNTPVGHILNTVLRAGSKLYISSRANGDYRGTHNGVPAVDDDSFKLESFDFVLEPGFLQANPALVESLQEDLKELKDLIELSEEKKEDNFKESTKITPKIEEAKEEENKEYVKEVLEMKELIEALTTEKRTLTEELGKALKNLNEVKTEKESLSAEVSALQKTLTDTKEKASKSELYEKLGSPEEVEKALDLSEKVIWKYKQSGSPDEVGKALDQSYEQLKKYRELGSPEEISTAFDKAEALIVKYRELGTIAELNEALDTATKMFKRFQDLGSPSEITLALDKSSKLIENIKSSNFKKRVESLSTELGIPSSKITELAKKMTNGEIRSFVKTLTESNKLKDKYLVTNKDGKGGKKDPKKEATTDPIKDSIFNKTLGQTLMENFTR